MTIDNLQWFIFIKDNTHIYIDTHLTVYIYILYIANIYAFAILTFLYHIHISMIYCMPLQYFCLHLRQTFWGCHLQTSWCREGPRDSRDAKPKRGVLYWNEENFCLVQVKSSDLSPSTQLSLSLFCYTPYDSMMNKRAFVSWKTIFAEVAHKSAWDAQDSVLEEALAGKESHGFKSGPEQTNKRSATGTLSSAH